MKPKIILAIIIVIIIGIKMAIFPVDETEQVIITQMGKYIRTINEPGLAFKIPLIQTAHFFEKRVLEYDASPAEILTVDKKNLVVDNYARWKIIDPLKFYKTVRTEAGAIARLDDIVFSEVREELARHELVKIVDIHRKEIMKKITEKCRVKAKEYGIDILDVRIKRADLPKEVEESVYARMRAERYRIAQKYRSEGEEEAAKIRAETDKKRTIILADAYKQAQKIKGEGDAEAIKIYAKAFEKDPEFYDFLRTLEAYKKTIDKETTFVLGSDSELFKYLNTLKR
ncbi:MAG TPA: protease modulator HflC [Syntrophaceae bacterium]|nr:protease modulator HflC [Syntrophaceae bacterium]